MRRGGRSSAYDRPGGRARSADGMNATERRYRDEVLEPRRRAGEILAYRFEPFALKLAPRTYYRPDFLVVVAPVGEWRASSTSFLCDQPEPDVAEALVLPAITRAASEFVDRMLVGRVLQIHEVKGRWEDAGNIKIKVAASQNPWFRFVAVRPIAGRHWEFEEIPTA